MEGERYNLEKAQEEAQKLTKKVESGEVSSYTEAERQLVLDRFRSLLLKDMAYDGSYIKRAQAIKNESNLTDNEILPIVKNAIVHHLSSVKQYRKSAVNSTSLQSAIIIKKTFNISDEDLSDKGIEDIVKRDVVDGLTGVTTFKQHLDRWRQFNNEAVDRILTSEEVQTHVREDAVRRLNNLGETEIGSSFWESPIYDSADRLEALNISFNSLATEVEDKEAVTEYTTAVIKDSIKGSNANQVRRIGSLFNVPEQRINELVQEVVLNMTEGNSFFTGNERVTVTKVIDTFQLSKQILSSARFQEAAKSRIAENIQGFTVQYNFNDTQFKERTRKEMGSVQEVFSIPDNSITALVLRKIVECKKRKYQGDDEAIQQLKQEFQLSEVDTTNNFNSVLEEKDWNTLIVMKEVFPDCVPLYGNLVKVRKDEVLNSPKQTTEEKINWKSALSDLAGLAQNGDYSVAKEFIDIISSRASQTDQINTKTGLAPTQEAAFAILYRLDNPETNNALLSLLTNETIPLAVKRSTLTKLTKENSSFLDEHSLTYLRNWLHSQELEKLNWNDLSFLGDIENISASESRKIAKFYAAEVIAGFGLIQESCYEVWKQQYPDIPQNTFLQLCKFLQGNSRDSEWESYRGDVMEKFQILYKSLRREGSKRDMLLSAVASSHNINPELLDLIIQKLSDINFEKKEDADKITKILKLTAFLDSVDRIISYGYNENEYDNEEHENDQQENLGANQKKLSPELANFFSQNTKTLEELKILLESAVSNKIKEVLPNEEITAERIEGVVNQWRDIEPIFTYLKRHPNLKTYIAEMFANFDSKENWKAWRYNLKDSTVKKQVGHLSSEQLEIWQNNHVAEVGDFEIQEGSSSKPEQIKRILIDAIVRDRHINNEQAEGIRLPFAQRILAKALLGLDENIEQGQKNLVEATKQVNDLASKLDVLILSANSLRVEQTLNNIIPPDKNITASSKIENSLKALKPFLSTEVFEAMLKTYKDIPEKTNVSSNILISPDTRKSLAVKLRDIKQQADEISKSTIWQELELSPLVIPEISIIYQKRAELKAILEILRLTDLSPRQIALNILTEGRKKEEGSSITSTIDNLKKVFKDCAFMQDLKNVEYILKEQTQFIGKRRLAMVLSDNPSFLWQAGKYPIGNGSCQHYAEGSMSQSLMGYVGDAHIKVSYLFDINSLSENLKTKIKDGVPIGEIVDQATPPEILQAVVARSMVKVGKDEQNRPSIFMEPTYSVINKGDISMDRYFNLFTDLFVAEPMKSKLFRGSGSEKLNIPPSRNPEGQYEDGAVENAQNAGMGIQTFSYSISAKSISKDHTPTTEEELIVENMKRSSR